METFVFVGFVSTPSARVSGGNVNGQLYKSDPLWMQRNRNYDQGSKRTNHDARYIVESNGGRSLVPVGLVGTVYVDYARRRVLQ